MSRPRSLLADYLVYLVVRLLVAAIQLLPYATACQVAASLAWLAYHVDRRHRLVAIENLRHAFPGRYTEAELDALVRAVYRHFCTLVVDIIQVPRTLRAGNWRRYVRLDETPWSRLLLSGRPLLFVTGHFGNWEMGGYSLGLLGLRSYAVARTLDNAFLDDYLRRFRESTGQKLLATKGEFDQIDAVLAGGGVLESLGV